MTPDEARDLLDGTTPGPWEAYDPGDGTARLYGADNNRIIEHVTHGDAGSYMSQPNGVLAAAAPTLAAMIAGMREEWGVAVAYPGLAEVVEWGFDTRDGAEAEGSTLAAEYRVVRRYVTEPEADQ